MCVFVRRVGSSGDWRVCALCEASCASGPVASVPCCCVSGRCPRGAVVRESRKVMRCCMDLHAVRGFTAAASVDGSLKETTRHGRVQRRAAYGVWEGMQPGLSGSAAFVEGAWGGRLPSDWEIADCEMYAVLRYLRSVVARSADPSSERVLVLSDCGCSKPSVRCEGSWDM